jgi:RHS repeat-associated protein
MAESTTNAPSLLQITAIDAGFSDLVPGQGTVTYTYDSQSRRIATQVRGNTTLVAYDGWNPIAEWSADLQSATLTKTYTWGMDLSGSMQGAGGVGGLLAVSLITNNSITNTFYPTYDGNGNVSEYLDNIGTIVAHYEYDPFGRVIVESGDQFADFAHRFSTKPQDLTTGLLYYGYRWYDPVTGRWSSRDPIEEEGGVNLYGFVGNNGVIKWDFLGFADGGFFMFDFDGTGSEAIILYPCECDSDIGRYKNLSFTLANETLVQSYEVKDPANTLLSFVREKIVEMAEKKLDELAGDSVWVKVKDKLKSTTSTIEKYSSLLSISHEIGTGMTVQSITMSISFDLCIKDNSGEYKYVPKTAFGDWTDTTGLSIADESQRKLLPDAYKSAMLEAAQDMVKTINDAKE